MSEWATAVTSIFSFLTTLLIAIIVAYISKCMHRMIDNTTTILDQFTAVDISQTPHGEKQITVTRSGSKSSISLKTFPSDGYSMTPTMTTTGSDSYIGEGMDL